MKKASHAVGMRGENTPRFHSRLSLEVGGFTARRPEGFHIPRAHGRTFGPAGRAGLQPVALPLLVRVWNVLFPITAL